ncbi:MAG: PAS domain-containing protein, partial [Bacteroidota bacterium]|nr:PAS domain-containing protein [Bacteroidota bacterium]
CKEELIGRGLFEAFPNPPDDPELTSEKRLRASLEYTIAHKEPHRLPVHRYDITNADGSFEERYWSAVNKPVLNEDGAVVYIIHSAEDVTAQIIAEHREEKIKDLEKSYHLFMQAPVTIGIVKGDDYVIELANDNLLQVWGRTADVIGKPLLQAIPELQGQGYIELLNQVRETGTPYYAFERPITLVRNGKKEVLYFDFVYKPYYEQGNDKAIGVFAVGHDVTVLVQARQKFKNVIEQAKDPILILKGEDMVLEVANEALFKIWNVSASSIGKTFLEILPEMRGQGFLELLQQVYRTGEPFQGYEVPAVFEEANGEKRTVYFNFTYQPYREVDGSISGVLVLATDVSEQVAAKRKVEESSQELQLAVEIADLGTFQIDWLRQTGSFTNQIRDWFGFTQGQMDMNTIISAIHPEDQHRVIQALEWSTVSDENSHHDMIYRVQNRFTGKEYHLRSIGKALFKSEGKAYQIIGVIQDITAQVLHQKKLEESEEELQKRVLERTLELEMRNRELEQFTHVSHHDLQEPLRKIMMFTNMVQSEGAGKLSEASQMRLEKVADAASRMSAALRDILNYASLNKEGFMEVGLDEVLAAVQTDLELVIAEKKARITYDALPTVKAVPQQMHQLFYNLISNALKFSKPGASSLIHIACRSLSNEETAAHPDLDQQKRFYEILVHDNGIGFNQEAADKIFGMFQRLHSKQTYAGTGIGLALCKKVMMNHGGKIWANSLEGEGATFHVLLPAE